MRQKSVSTAGTPEKLVRDIRRATRKQYSAEEKIRIVLEGLRGEENISELCRREGIAASMYYGWSKEFLDAGKRRLVGDTARAATTDELKQFRREAPEKMRQLEPALTVGAISCTTPECATGAGPALARCLALAGLPSGS